MNYHLGQGAIVLDGALVATASVIGAGAIIYPGVRIGRGAQIDPGCVVKADVPAFSRVSREGDKVSGIASDDLSSIMDALINKTLTKHPGDFSEAAAIASRLSRYLPFMDVNAWAPAYEMCAGLLFNDAGPDDATRIRKELLPSLTGFTEAPTSNCGNPSNRVAVLVKHAAAGSYEPWARVMEILSALPPCEVYIHGNARKREVCDIENLGHSPVRCLGTWEEKISEIRQRCESSSIGTLISDHYGAVPTAVFNLRSAPRQWYLSDGIRWMPCDAIIPPKSRPEWVAAAI
jgi:hypothetical protein